MMRDIATVMWKEFLEVRVTVGGRSRWNIPVFIAAFGVLLPWQAGPRWVSSPMMNAYWVWLPLLMVNAVIADAFAGERERHTLETLLSSRLPDHAILLGKYAVAILYGCAFTWIGLLASLITVNVVHGHGHLLMYPPLIGSGVVVFSLLTAALAAGLGILISERASTVRQAQQLVGITMMVIVILPLILLPSLPSRWTDHAAQTIFSYGVTRLVIIAGALLLVVDVGLLALSLVRFRRARLILD